MAWTSISRATKWANLTGHAEGFACLSEEGQSERRQTNLMGHAEGHACLSESDEVKYSRPIGWGMHRDAHFCQRSDEVKYGRPIRWGMQRGAHICQRSNMQRMAHIISIYYCWLISLLILYSLSLTITLQDKKWKTLSSSFTCREQQQLDNTATKPKKVTAKLAKNFGGKTNHWTTCQGPCNLVSQHDMINFGACIGAVKYHLLLWALCTKRNSPLVICSIS